MPTTTEIQGKPAVRSAEPCTCGCDHKADDGTAKPCECGCECCATETVTGKTTEPAGVGVKTGTAT